MSKIRITHPCSKAWSELTPSQGGRHCHSCDRVVHDVFAMSKAELSALLGSQPDLCVRALILPDGSAVTTDDLALPRSSSRRALLVSVLAAASLACGAPDNLTSSTAGGESGSGLSPECTRPAPPGVLPGASEAELSAEEMQQVHEKLASLGYVIIK